MFLDPAALGALPFEAAILRADADVVEASDRGAFAEQRGSVFLLSRLRKAGFLEPAPAGTTAQTPPTTPASP